MMNDLSLTMLQKVLDAAALRHKAIANNLANANTPGYQRRIVSFGDQLERAMAARDPEGIRAFRPRLVKSADPAVRPDGNNVSPERELADLMRNSLYYSACTQLLSSRLAAYRAAISGDTRTS